MARPNGYTAVHGTENTVDQRRRLGLRNGIIPKQLGAYKIQSLLGEGGVAVVYRALDRNMPTALKVLDQSAAAQKSVRDGFRREFKTTYNLRHPGIIRSTGTGQIDGQFYITMELVEGETLEAFLRRNKSIGEVAAIDIIKQVADALNFIHENGIVHRDIKPSNIMITHNNRAKLFDFGASIDLNNLDPESLEGVYGTLGYISPEQAQAKPDVDGRSDLYSLGLILYRMVTGRKPFYGTRQEVLESHVATPPPYPSEFVRISPDLEEFILKAIAKDPADRYQTGQEFSDALTHIELLPPPEPFSQRARRWLGIGNPQSAEAVPVKAK
ncbi:MAG: serine/threonine-protein kinase [Chloroflexota bacterium]